MIDSDETPPQEPQKSQDLQTLLHPFVFMLQRNDKQENTLNYSLCMMNVGKPETYPAFKRKRKAPCDFSPQ